MHDVAVLHHVVFAFLAQAAGGAAARFAVVAIVILEAGGFRFNEPVLEVRVDDPGGLRGFRAHLHRPRPDRS